MCQPTEEARFTEFRRKIGPTEVLSASLEKLASQIHFNGKAGLLLQNVRILKPRYEEGYSRTKSGT